MPTEQDVVDTITVSLDLAVDLVWKRPVPLALELPEIFLKFTGRRLSRVIQKLHARDTAVAVEHREFISFRSDERRRIDLASLHDVLRKVFHVLFAIVEQPRDRPSRSRVLRSPRRCVAVPRAPTFFVGHIGDTGLRQGRHSGNGSGMPSAMTRP